MIIILRNKITSIFIDSCVKENISFLSKWRRGGSNLHNRPRDRRALHPLAQHRAAHDACRAAGRRVRQAAARLPHPPAGRPAHPHQGTKQNQAQRLTDITIHSVQRIMFTAPRLNILFKLPPQAP